MDKTRAGYEDHIARMQERIDALEKFILDHVRPVHLDDADLDLYLSISREAREDK